LIANVLSIAGTDPTGGAGIQADIKTISALGGYAMAVVTAVVAQNTREVKSYVALDPGFVGEQLDAVFEDVRVDAVKIGMVATARMVEVIAGRLRQYGAPNIVLDPVMVATSGRRLLDPEGIQALRELLIPLATVVTPNLPEAEVLLGMNPMWSRQQMYTHAAGLLELGPAWVLLKGGHLDGDASIDVLCGQEGAVELTAPRIATRHGHGTGCALSSAIATLLPSHTVEESARGAKAFLHAALAASGALQVGEGRGPVHHFHKHWPGPSG